MTRRVNKAYGIILGEKGPVAGMIHCLKGEFIGSALVLCYSAIDMMAWLSLPAGRDEVEKRDFIKWAEMYVLPNGSLTCTAEDLYAARCGLVHTMTPESRLSNQGRAVQIVYSWGEKRPYPREKLQKLGLTWVMLHVDTLCQAVARGAQQFLADVLKDRGPLAVVNSRARKLFQQDKRLPDELPI